MVVVSLVCSRLSTLMDNSLSHKVTYLARPVWSSVFCVEVHTQQSRQAMYTTQYLSLSRIHAEGKGIQHMYLFTASDCEWAFGAWTARGESIFFFGVVSCATNARESRYICGSWNYRRWKMWGISLVRRATVIKKEDTPWMRVKCDTEKLGVDSCGRVCSRAAG